MANLQEFWKDIEGYEGFYQISSLCRIKSLARIDCKGQRRKERILKLSLDSDGYLLITLAKDRVNKTVKPHRILANAFIPNPLGKPEVNHIDGDKINNDLTNLEWVTTKENQQHSRDIGIHSEIAETHKFAKLRNKDVLAIFRDNRTCKEIAKDYPVNSLTISRIKSGYLWGSITGKEYRQQRPSTFLDRGVVLQIFNSPLTPINLSKEIGLPQGVIAMIKRGQTYSSITGKTHEVKKHSKR